MSTDQTRSSKLDESEGLPHMHPGMKRSLLGAHNVQHEPIYEAQELEQISPAHRNAQVRLMSSVVDLYPPWCDDAPILISADRLYTGLNKVIERNPQTSE